MKPLKLILALFACACLQASADEAMSLLEMDNTAETTKTPDADNTPILDKLVIITDPTSHPSLETSFTLTEPFGHYHLSRLGSHYIYAFSTRPAFTGRDLFLDYTYRTSDDCTEQQYQVALNWAFTQQIGLIAEIPYTIENIDGVTAESGIGDLALVPRVSVIESDRFLIALQTEFGLPTSNRSFGGETTIAPGIAAWTDLGHGFTLNSQISIEHGFDSEETQLDFRFALIKSNSGKFAHTCVDGECDHGGDVSQYNYHLEISGNTLINGDKRGDLSMEGLAGVSYNISENFDIRVGYLFPLSTPHEFNHGFTTGLIYQF